MLAVRMVAALIVLIQLGCVWRPKQTLRDFQVPTPIAPRQTLVLGFLGGWEPWDNEKRWVRKLALKLRARKLPGVFVETVENSRRHLALELIRRCLDRDGNRTLDENERSGARIILYGQSFGGAAVAKLSRELHALSIPVLLAVQVDSVGRNDALVPPNVARAANLYQRDSWPIRGEAEIRAEDPSRTRILGNFRYHYKGKKIDLAEAGWLKRVFGSAHTKMDFDPEVWAAVERLLLEELGVQETRP